MSFNAMSIMFSCYFKGVLMWNVCEFYVIWIGFYVISIWNVIGFADMVMRFYFEFNEI